MFTTSTLRALAATFSAALFTAVLSIATAHAQGLSEDRAVFVVLGPEDEPIGWQVEAVSRNADGWLITRERAMHFSVDGHDPIRTSIIMTRTLSETGRVTSATIDSDINGTEQSFHVSFHGTAASISRTLRGKTRIIEEPVPAGLDFEDPDSLLDIPDGDHFSLGASSGRFTNLYRAAFPGKEGLVTDIRFWQDFPIHILDLEFSKDGILIKAVKPLLGSPISFVRMAEGDQPSNHGHNRINHQMIPAPYSIGGSAKSGKIRYEFGLIAPLAELIPQTAEQGIRQTSGGLSMTICSDCGPGFPDDAESLALWRQPTEWLQSDSPAFQTAVRRIDQLQISDADKVRRLTRVTRNRLNEIDLNGHLSALDAWQRRSGDCTEDAVVLAALARAAGIPARVASGIVYSRERYHGASNGFIPHSWVMAYVDGGWRSFDATQGSFDSTHIALTIGDGDARSIAAATQIAAMLDWQMMAEIRPRPSE